MHLRARNRLCSRLAYKRLHGCSKWPYESTDVVGCWQSWCAMVLPPPLIILGLYLSTIADARIRRTPGVRKLPYQYEGPIVDKSGAELPPLDTTYYFDQLIDHNNPSLGTFEQRYWHTWQFYESGTSPRCISNIHVVEPGHGRRSHSSHDTWGGKMPTDLRLF